MERRRPAVEDVFAFWRGGQAWPGTTIRGRTGVKTPKEKTRGGAGDFDVVGPGAVLSLCPTCDFLATRFGQEQANVTMAVERDSRNLNGA
ncbi:hypothetical protein ERJ75_000117000 [Trypanosoma vivax]|nr:hypothetical protein ERJ75_000117000 [Trypanosoma vivax]